MGTRLTIDIGNTATKVSLWRGDTLSATEVMPMPDIRHIEDFLADECPSAAILCSVRGYDPAFADSFRSRIAPLTILSHTTPVPLANAYATPATLGMDRLAAAVGAAAIAPGRQLLVADLGTAATYDHVTASGTYAGGNIAPGVTMRLEALHCRTSRLPALDVPRSLERPTDARPFATDTRSAMLHGAVLGVVAELTFYRSLLGADAVTVITGGDAPLIAPLLDFHCITDEHLVGRGLNRILHYNET